MGEDLRRVFGQASKKAARRRVGNAVEHSCIGRIVSMLTFILIFACAAIYGGAMFLLYQVGILDALPDVVQTMLMIGFFVGFLAAIVIAGLIGNWLRGRLWRTLLRR